MFLVLDLISLFYVPVAFFLISVGSLALAGVQLLGFVRCNSRLWEETLT